ncbi:MAG: pilus assembly protein TadG-related protein [Actinomycetia bacterium]|nr:pilus assembly protein TadG-related protein [Actinomycetes bacterium]
MSRIREDGGAVAVLTAVLSVMLFGIAALVVDLGIARDNRRQAQNTADSASLAAANALYATTAPNLNKPGDFQAAVDAAKSYAAKNYGTTDAEWAGCVNNEPLPFQFPGTGSSCISFDSFLYPKQVLVVVPLRKQPSMFGGVFGYTGVSIGALAQARLDPGGKNICTFCVLGSGTQSIQNGNLTVSGGNMWFNGNVNIKNNGYAGSLAGYVTGDDGTQTLDGGNAYVSGTVKGSISSFQGGKGQTGQPKIVDPLASYQLPFATQQTLSPKVNPCADGPGIYAGYKSTSSAPCVMQPGLYVFTGDFELAGNAGQLQANGVTFYFTCGSGTTPAACGPGTVTSPGETGGGIKISGNGGYVITAPSKATVPTQPEELYGWAIVYDRYNNADMRLTGNGTSTVSGTIYGVNATLDLRGNGGSDVPFASLIVVGGLNFDGNNATMNVAFDSSKNVKPGEGARGLVR